MVEGVVKNDFLPLQLVTIYIINDTRIVLIFFSLMITDEFKLESTIIAMDEKKQADTGTTTT